MPVLMRDVDIKKFHILRFAVDPRSYESMDYAIKCSPPVPNGFEL